MKILAAFIFFFFSFCITASPVSVTMSGEGEGEGEPDRDTSLLQKLRQIINEESHTVGALATVSSASDVCDVSVTAHYVLYNDLVLGISVAHFPCYQYHTIPSFVVGCPGVDVSLWIGCPPAHVSLLNITNSVVTAKLGDHAMVFGLVNDRPRIWTGHIAGWLGRNSTGHHFSPNIPENANELVFQGAQEVEMSGGGAINGKGKYHVVILLYIANRFVLGYLGVARAVHHTDKIGNTMPVIVPFNLFESCIKLEAAAGRISSTKDCGKHDVLTVPVIY